MQIGLWFLGACFLLVHILFEPQQVGIFHGSDLLSNILPLGLLHRLVCADYDCLFSEDSSTSTLLCLFKLLALLILQSLLLFIRFRLLSEYLLLGFLLCLLLFLALHDPVNLNLALVHDVVEHDLELNLSLEPALHPREHIVHLGSH